MAKAIFTGEVHYTSMTKNAGWSAYPSDEPQSYPEEFVAYAESVGRATRVDDKASAPTKPAPGK